MINNTCFNYLLTNFRTRRRANGNTSHTSMCYLVADGIGGYCEEVFAEFFFSFGMPFRITMKFKTCINNMVVTIVVSTFACPFLGILSCRLFGWL